MPPSGAHMSSIAYKQYCGIPVHCTFTTGCSCPLGNILLCPIHCIYCPSHHIPSCTPMYQGQNGNIPNCTTLHACIPIPMYHGKEGMEWAFLLGGLCPNGNTPSTHLHVLYGTHVCTIPCCRYSYFCLHNLDTSILTSFNFLLYLLNRSSEVSLSSTLFALPPNITTSVSSGLRLKAVVVWA